MTSTSSEPVVLRDLPVDAVATADSTHDLREGAWTRFGGARVLGDQVTEHTLRGIAERSHATARAQGFASGWAEGLRAAQERSARGHDAQAALLEEQRRAVMAELELASAALASALETSAETSRALRAELHERALDLALEIAAAVLDREVALAADPAADAVRRALATVTEDVPFVVRLHPADLAVLDPALLADRQATVVGDAAVARGSAQVETEQGFVDADVAGAL